MNTYPPNTEFVIVTGAAGLIGSVLVERLLSRGHAVIGIDNFMLGSRENLSNSLKMNNFHLIEGDLNQPNCQEQVSEVLANGTAIELWHMAANSDIAAGVSNPDIDMTHTFLTTHNTLKMMRELKIPHLFFASSSAIYGEKEIPLVEDMGPLFPISNYGAMKLASEAAITAALESYLKRAWIFRFPNVVGPRLTHGVIFALFERLAAKPDHLLVLGDGTQEKQYLHTSELLDAMFFLREKCSEPLNFFNIGVTGSTTTVAEIAGHVLARLAPDTPIRYGGGKRGWVGDVPKFQFCTKKINDLGWHPKLSSTEAVIRTIDELVSARGLNR